MWETGADEQESALGRSTFDVDEEGNQPTNMNFIFVENERIKMGEEHYCWSSMRNENTRRELL